MFSTTLINLLKILSIILFHINPTYQDIRVLTQQFPINPSDIFYSIDAASSHIMTISGQSADPTLAFYPVSDMTGYSSFMLLGFSLEQAPKIRTAEFNTQGNFPNIGFLYFTSTYLLFFPKFSQAYQKILDLSLDTLTIQQTCFGPTTQYIYMLTHQTVGNIYYIFFYDTSISNLVNKVTLIQININTNSIDKFLYDNGRLVLMFDNMLIVYECVGFNLGAVLFKVSYSTGFEVDVVVSGDLLIYSIDRQVQIYDLTGSNNPKSLTHPTTIYSLQLHTTITNTTTNTTKTNYLITTNPTQLTQYDLDISTIISTTIFTTISTSSIVPSYQRIHILANNNFVAYSDNTGQFDIYGVSSSYGCITTGGCNGCYVGYGVVGGLCEKGVTTGTGAIINITNTTNITIPSTTKNTPINPPSNNTSIHINITEINQQLSGYLQIFSTPTTSYLLSISTIRAMPKFLLIFTILINDLIYYKQHRKVEPSYPNSTLIFMEKFDVMKQLGVSSFYSNLPFLEDNRFEGLNQSNQKMRREMNFGQNDPQQVYFLFATSDIYQYSIFTNILYYLILKLLHLILHISKPNQKILKKLHQYISTQTKWWTIIISIIQINAVELIFAGSLQSLKFSSGYFGDKINLIVMVGVMFLVVFYVGCFYVLVYAGQEKDCSKNLLVYTKGRKMGSYFFQPFLFLVRGVIKSFVHGYLTEVYSTQIVILLIVDIIFLVACLLMRRNFRNSIISTLITMYLLGFLLFDLYFVIQIHTDLTVSWNRQLVGLILCLSLAGVALLLALFFFVSSVIEIMKVFKNLFFSNEVYDIKRQIKFEEFDATKCRKIVGIARSHNIQRNMPFAKLEGFQQRSLQRKDCLYLENASQKLERSKMKQEIRYRIIKQKKKKRNSDGKFKVITNHIPDQVEHYQILDMLQKKKDKKLQNMNSTRRPIGYK